MQQRSAPGDLAVESSRSVFEFARVTEEMRYVFDARDRDNGVLIATPERLQGVLTLMDFLRYLCKVASPFVMISEIELTGGKSGCRPEAVDRFCFREMRDFPAGDVVIWTGGRVFLWGVDFAKRRTSRAACAPCRGLCWSCLKHQLAGLRANLVQKLPASSPKIRVLLPTILGVDELPHMGIEPRAETKWRRGDVVELTELFRLLAATGAMSAPLASVFARSMRSSPAALEEVLQCLRSGVFHRDAEILSSIDEVDLIRSLPHPS